MGIKHLVLAVLLAIPCASHAVPTLFFDGQFHFDAVTGLMTIDAVIEDSVDLSQPIGAQGSTFSLVTRLGSVGSNGPFVEAAFVGAGGQDLSAVNGGDASLLLGAEVVSLLMSGFEGDDIGFLDGVLDAQSGLLLSDFFTDTTLFALQLELTAPFSLDMFLSSFSGVVDGQLIGTPGSVGVPEPGSMALFAIGLVGLFWARKKQQIK